MRVGRIAIAFVAALTLASASGAHAAPGDLSGPSCISNSGADGCTPLADPGVLTAAAGVVVAPDGSDVYVGAAAGVAHFRRAADGTLTYAGCVDVSSSAGSACPTDAPPDAANALALNAILLAIAPDGKHLYAVSWADALLWWERDTTTGELTWGGCRDGAADAATNGRCGTATTFAGGNFPAGSLDFSQGIEVTPDGETLYIADQTNGLLQADLDPATGVATPTACFDTAGSAPAGCTALAAATPLAASGLDVAANSRDVYLRSISPGGITHFTRSEAGVTAFADCIGYSSPSPPCATAAPQPVFSYSGSIGVRGDTVYSAVGNYGTPSGTVARFDRAEDGSLGFLNCTTTEAVPGPCTSLPAGTLTGSIGKLTVAPDGSNVYLKQGGSVERSLTRLTGSLGFGSCLSDTGVPGCSAPALPAPFAYPTGAMTISPDGRQVYQSAADAINTYQVERVATGGGPPPTGTPARLRATSPRIRSVRRNRRGRYLIKVAVVEPGTISARFRGRLKPKGRVRTLGRVATKLARRPGTFSLRVDPGAAARKRKARARLVVTVAPPGYLPAESSRKLRLR